MNKFNTKEVQAKIRQSRQLINEGKIQEKLIGIGSGLLIKVRKSSAKYQARVISNGKKTTITIGDVGNITLSDAYNQAKFIAEKVKNEDVENKKVPLFKDFWFEYRATTDRALGLSQDRITTKNSYYNTVLKVLADLRLDEITPLAIKEKLKGINKKQNWLNDCLCALVACMTYAQNQGIIKHNDISNITKLPEYRHNKAEEKEFKWIPIEQLKEKLFTPLKDFPLDYRVYILLVSMTASRVGEIRNLTWNKIDFTPTENAPYGQIHIPNSETKTKRDVNHLDHIIPLTLPLLNLLKNYQKISEFLFDGDSPFLFPAKRDHNKARSPSGLVLPTNITAYLSAHGLRKTANTFLVSSKFDDRFSENDIDKILSHKSDDKVHKTYNKYDYVKELYRILDFYNEYIVTKCLPYEFLELTSSNFVL